ncbi:hypothetical protein GCM10009647_051150 [Streptomyces sanglieri]
MGVGKVGLERGPAHGRSAGRVLSSRFAYGHVDKFEQVAVRMEERAVQSEGGVKPVADWVRERLTDWTVGPA